ncbi:hypothetical protein QO010_000699 [Caulobacter ginsengisoli]|uniref:Uncharacterized protein n=1 Tax=Caulobacter ginsengisoli TaxID=400775 RepID=A0ABU0ILQ4_9CAUL|nr:hypothetical protein [Caulobacter ginsengisoli]MDQ0462951.1 hypothetical protein [Caulobacter ginsengisoli]
MSGDDFDQVFGRRPIHAPGFADRINRDQAAPAPGEPSEATAGSGPYKPYGFLPSGGLGESCEVVRWMDGTEVPEGLVLQYRFLMQIGFVGEEQLKLFLPDCIVVIDGKRLRDLRKKLSRRMATFIQQWNPRIWPAPPVGEPIIERISVMRPELLRSGS